MKRSDRNCPRLHLRTAWLAIACLPIPSVCCAGFHIVSQSADARLSAQATSFDVTFSEPLDFTPDEFGRAARTFQFAYNSDADGALFADPGALVFRAPESPEIHEIRIRRTVGPPDPLSGGWGPIVESIPFELDGNTLHFTVEWRALRETDLTFRYSVETFVYGGVSDAVTDVVTPLPSAAAAALPVGCAVVLSNIMRRRSLTPRRFSRS